jgi:hypothetical protein
VARDIVIHMGFLNTPYTLKNMAAPVAAVKAHEAKMRRRYSGPRRTAEDVGDILESKYGILGTFTDIYDEEISDIVTETFENFVVDALSEVRKPTSARMVKFMASKTNKIEKLFRGFLDQEEMNGMVPGVPTKVSRGKKRKRGISTRQRPSFERSGIYRVSFRCWADIK